MDYAAHHQKMTAEAVYLVEATSFEHLVLWSENHEQLPSERLTWEQCNPGFWETIGQVGERPVCVSIMWDRVGSHVVAFWEATSEVADFRMIGTWLSKRFPGVSSTNAMNFHNVVLKITRMNEGAR